MKKGIKNMTRVISVMLSLVLAVQCVPMQVFAEGNNVQSSAQTTEAAENSAEKTGEEAKIIAEDESKREENVKHFIMSDGTMQAAQYNVPVHFQQNGEWVDYDNTLVETDADEEENKGKILKNKDLTVKNSDQNIRISKKTNGKKFVRIEKDGYKLSWYYQGAKKSTAEISQQQDDGDRTSLEKLSSSVCFKNVYKNTDFEYIISTDGLKENIILNSADTKREFVAEYKANGLTPVQIDSKTVELQNGDGKAIYILTAPCMTDANGEFSDGITLSLSNAGNNTFTVTTTLDASWLDDGSRAYPVTVDPVVMTKPDVKTIQNKYITSNNNNLTAYGSMYVGDQRGQMGRVRSAVKFTALPTLDKGDMVTNAAVFLGQLGYDHASQPNLQINAYEITSEWNGFNASSPGICSTDNPTHDSRVLDYVITTSAKNYNQISWDISSTVKKWYNDDSTNHGIFFDASDDRWAVAHLVSKHNNIKGGKPVMCVQYVNNKGLEDYWTFTEQNLGGGTGYVNNYTGNLVVNIPICDTGSASLPAGISYYYNGYQAGKHFAITQGGGEYEASKSLCGAGWKTTVDERLAYLTPGKGNNDDLHKQGIKYTYTDADGTVLYMQEKKDNNEKVIPNTFEDELGKGYTLKIRTEGGWELTDKQNNKKIFTGGGRLWMVQSNQSQDKIVYHYTGDSYYYKIVDGSGHEITITRNQYNAITAITNSLGTTQFSYNGSWLTKITYPDGGTMQFNYDNDYRLTSVTSRDGSSVVYTYPSTGDEAAKNRVIKVQEYSAPNANGVKTAGNSISFDYNIGNYTKVTDNKGRSVVYSFDEIGRTTSAVDELGATSAQYTKNVTENEKDGQKLTQNNKLTAASSGTQPIDNLLINTSYENSLTNWVTYTADSTGTITADSSNTYIGNKSAKFNITSKNINTYLSQMYYPTKTGKYTFSFYYKTTGLDGSGIRPMIGLWHTDGSLTYAVSSYKTASTGGEWERLSVTADVGSDITKIDVIINVPNTRGTVYVDCAQLEYGGSANAYNLAENSAFKNGAQGWSSNMQSGDSYNTTHGSIYDSGCPSFITNGVFIKGDASQNKYIRQNININLPASKAALQFSGYACARSVPKVKDRLQYFSLDLCFHYSDGTTEYVVVDFNYSSTTWQYASKLVMPSKDNQSKHVSYVTAYFLYYQNQNYACFSGMNLTLDRTGTAYSYDEKGNVVSAKDMAERENVPTIDSANRLTGYKDEEGVDYTYTYNTDNASLGTTQYQVKSVLHNYYAQQFDFSYDKHGNVIQTTHKNKNGTIPIQTNSTYSANGDRLLTATDSLRNTVTYNYSTSNSKDLRVQSVTQNGATVNYTYKPNTGIVTGVSSTVTGIDGTQKTISNTYGYTGDRLTSITHNGFNYGFTYDSFGNRLSTKVGSQTLMTDTYGANNGLLTKSTYGNGNYVENIYDRYDRVTGIKYNGVQKFGYEYNADGLVSRHTDSINGKTYNYTYDLLGRLQKTEISDGNSIGYKFDNVNNVTNTLYKFNGVTKSTTYNHFKGGVVCDVTYPNGATKTRKLNAHAQVRPSYLTTPAGKTWSINRQYYTPTIGGTTYTTNVMGNLIYESIDRTFSYAYNGSGNISKITDKVGTTAKESTFVYDEANQLIRENNAYTNKTVTYTYDAGGNILTKTEYPYTTGTLDGLTGTVVNYTYGNTNWKDLLTEFNGNAITYDQIGNPFSYYNGTTFTWERGRKLASATTAEGTAVSYLYNDSGIRTQKTVNGVATDYFLDGSKIIAEKTNGNTTWYYYDGDGTREAIEYKGNVYYYFYNAQGDVMGLYDNDLNVVVEYAYDSWGNVVSITGSLASTLGQDNPFRYRGYYFDSETGLYYLNSRYYDANTGRFINADGYLDTQTGLLSHNMYAYCNNNPVNMIDSEGTGPLFSLIKNGVIKLFKIIRGEDDAISSSSNNFTSDLISGTVEYGESISKAQEDYVTQVSNVVNYNSTKDAPIKKFNKKRVKIKPNHYYAKRAYQGISTVAMEMGYNLSEMTWEDVQNHPELEKRILNEYCIWDQQSSETIAKVYGLEWSVEIGSGIVFK